MKVAVQNSPHEMLAGLELPGGWKVVERVDATSGISKGSFSCGYTVVNAEGQRGYLKALDFFSRLRDSSDPARELQPLLEAFNFERDLLRQCGDRKLSRVVRALADGAVTIPEAPSPSTVQYIIFELAEGDVRNRVEVARDFDIAWALRSLHHIAVGLSQLHGIGVAHQDVKPANVLLFEGASASKLADLGRASQGGQRPPHYSLACAGDLSYAPPELLYRADVRSSDERHFGCDLYHLGSMVASMFTTLSMTHLIMFHLPDEYHWSQWAGSYEEVLPLLREAFGKALSYVEAELPEPFRADLTSVMAQLCEPDVRRRGHPLERRGLGNPFSLRRYVSRLNVLATTAEYTLVSGRKAR